MAEADTVASIVKRHISAVTFMFSAVKRHFSVVTFVFSNVIFII